MSEGQGTENPKNEYGYRKREPKKWIRAQGLEILKINKGTGTGNPKMNKGTMTGNIKNEKGREILKIYS